MPDAAAAPKPYVSAEMVAAGAGALTAFALNKAASQLVLNPLDLMQALPAVYRAMHTARRNHGDPTAAERKRRQRARAKGGPA